MARFFENETTVLKEKPLYLGFYRLFGIKKSPKTGLKRNPCLRRNPYYAMILRVHCLEIQIMSHLNFIHKFFKEVSWYLKRSVVQLLIFKGIQVFQNTFDYARKLQDLSQDFACKKILLNYHDSNMKSQIFEISSKKLSRINPLKITSQKAFHSGSIKQVSECPVTRPGVNVVN